MTRPPASPDEVPEGKESVWDYPRPPRLEPLARRVRVIVDNRPIVDSNNALRVLETSHPPTIYVPPDDVVVEYFRSATQRSRCEFKGEARYWDIVIDDIVLPAAAWSYPSPAPGYEAISGYISVFPGRVDACYLDDERVQPQEGDFYGGWITSEILGPFKGPPGTRGW
ncbi:DUF427 domain-containing protein [soil metagenome]